MTMRVVKTFAVIGLVVAGQIGGAAAGQAQTASVTSTPILSGNDRFHPVIARSGMVSSQEAIATRVGRDILAAGGNAVDAAVATGFALAVTLPRAGNLGGGGFMMVHMAQTGETLALDYRETAPAGAFGDMFLDDAGNADSRKSRFSGLAVGVPGTVAGLAGAHERFGSGTFTFAQLVAPAIALARNGFPVSDDLSQSLKRSFPRLSKDPDAADIFYKAGGGFYEPGDRLVQAELAMSLEKIAAQGARGFYEGPVADAIAARVSGAGGSMTTEDLQAYRAIWREPVTGTYQGYEIASMPPPSSGGVHIVEILNMLEPFGLSESGAGSAATLHAMAEAMKRAYADRSKYLGDPDFVDVPVKGLTSKAYAIERMADFDPARAAPASEVAPGAPQPYESNETTHFSVVDVAGNAVSNTYTLNFSYGVGMMASGTGILLNNELDDFSAKPGVPNAYGLIGGKANAVEPRKRPLSSMSPTLVFRDGEFVLATGSPGGSRIITTVLQVILNVVDHGMNIAEASAAPRMHHQWLPDELRVEEGFSPDTLKLLAEKGHSIAVKPVMGSTQSVMAVAGGLAGAADPRRQGAQAAGY
ncbi:gamma-glutamyltransferase [Stappia sp. ES.058]|uniref:gamma-glutamyltransferase n=1 Tax=Stappia sp. ES.058 TaxID=1881061 RepID=UPI00087D6EC7|nr:gamma-glutamyltransferase [Stappia sp. ES.058]SDU40023.1 gamma-glutamyltranspeptidase / glutathione hydrolase [Stappia sp. ES.058]